MIKQIGKFIGVAALIFTMVSCNNDDNDIIHEIEPGTFEASITGDFETQMAGVAVFIDYVDQMTGERAFLLGFGSSNQEIMNIWFLRAGEYPGDGTYDIQPVDFEDMQEEDWFLNVQEFVSYSERMINEQYELFITESGTISLEMTGDFTITGEFGITATGYLMDEEGPVEEQETSQVQITGSFNAVPGQ
jgi:hypothetical protein